MKVTLLNNTPLWVADNAISKCWDKPSKDGEVNVERIDRVANKHKHASTIEHITYNFDIDGISRACLQELARHRMANLSVKSSRYTLKELKDAISVEPFLVSTGDDHMDGMNQAHLEYIRDKIEEGVSNDKVKYLLPEAYKTSLVWTINARSLQNFLSLRTSKAALWEIRDLAYVIYEELPEDHKFLFKDHVNEDTKD